MDPRLQDLISETRDEALDDIRYNPSEWEPGDLGTLLQTNILNAGLGHEFSESDMIKAAKEIGIKDDDIESFLEQMASWL